MSALVPWRLDLNGWVYVLFVVAGLAVAGALILEGAQKQRESNDAIFQAVFSRKADFPSIETARTGIAQALGLEREREQELNAQEEESRTSELRAATEANLVTIALKGGAGQGSDPDMEMTSVYVDITNDSDRPVVIERFELNPPLMAKRYPNFPFRLQGNDVHSANLEVYNIAIDRSALSGKPISQFTADLMYKLDGRSWTRTSAEDSRPVLLG